MVRSPRPDDDRFVRACQGCIDELVACYDWKVMRYWGNYPLSTKVP